MANLKSLLKDTVIYGISSIFGRFLNYLLVPLYTYYMPKDSGDYGTSVNIYAYTALIFAVLTFGMETTMFRYANKKEEQPDTVFSTAMAVVCGLSLLFLASVALFIEPISVFLNYEGHSDYLLIMATVVALDGIQALPFCYLRFQKRAIKFATLKMLFIIFNISLNLIYFVWLGKTSVFYVFIINLWCTSAVTFFFVPDLLKIKWRFDVGLLRRMLKYSWPMLILSLAGVLNQTADKIVFPLVADEATAKAELGVYGACAKIAMIMALITQAFRYAYEPIVFSKQDDKDSKEYYAKSMKYFIIFTLLAFLAVMGYMNILEKIIGAEYREGLVTVPIVMAAEMMMGIYFNLSFWYKLIDKTYWGAILSITGCVVLVSVNLMFIPEYGYMACAWAGVAGYGTAMLLSYFIGQHYNKIDYPLGSIFSYVALTAVLYFGIDRCNATMPPVGAVCVNTALILLFCLAVYSKEFRRPRRPLKSVLKP